jgi:hypothetical protein
MKKIKAEIIADSLNEHGQRCTTYILTYPRIIHAEVMTHRVFSRNAASSRAIPFKKMLSMVKEDPFIPIAFQKDHKGMQGTEYITHDDNPVELVNGNIQSDLDRVRSRWRDSSVSARVLSERLHDMGVTKQLCNRTLEPYLWYTCIVTSTEFENFFKLRCPQYKHGNGKNYKSRKDFIADTKEVVRYDRMDWFKVNEGAGEIHIMELAERMYDAMNESTPKQLKAGEWHIPFGDRFDLNKLEDTYNSFKRPNAPYFSELDPSEIESMFVKIATARCARVSYENFEGKDDYESDIKLYDRLATMGHASPFEHCAKAMGEIEYGQHVRGKSVKQDERCNPLFDEEHMGWCGNFRGFIQVRKTMEENGKI